MNKILIICGPTATGKTKLAVDIAKKFNGELVSADSRQVYRGMDIVTGKGIDTQSKKQKTINNIPIWGVDACYPDYRFNVSEYVELANKVIKDIESRGKLPIVVGGTGFYLRGLFGNIETLGIPPNFKLRKELDRLSVSELQNKLFQLDQLVQLDKSKLKPLNQSDRNNPRRLIRAIEVSIFEKQKAKNPPSLKASAGHSNKQQTRFARDNEARRATSNDLDTLWFGLTADMPMIRQRIAKRVADRIQVGAENEIRTLLKTGYNWDNSALGTTIGYRQWRDFFDGKATREGVIQKWQFAEHAYARRQLTWFNKEKQISWFDISKSDWQKTIQEKVARWLVKS